MSLTPSIGDLFWARLAKAHAQRVYRGLMTAARRAAVVQEKVLLAKIRRNADSRFGREHGFDKIRSAADFVRRVPIMDYEAHRPYLEEVKNGNPRALLGSGQRVLMFALTSGTTDQPKYVPVTKDFLAEYRRGWNAFGVKALLDHPAAIFRPILQVSSRMDESHTPSGIPCGAISGLMAATQKRLIRKYYVSPPCLAAIDEPAAKYYTLMRLALPLNVGWVVTASPATQIKLAETANTHRESLIRDIRDGTLSADVEVPRAVREALAPRLSADRQCAQRLERLISEHGELLPKHYWSLGFLANWTGGTLGLYLREFPRYFGDVPVRDIGLLASEGRVSIPVEDGSPAGILDVLSHFFEFVPRDCIDQTSPPVLRCHEVEVGTEYFVVMTTSSGLCRYNLGDLVRVVGFLGQAPLIEFLNKGSHVSSVTGEKLTEHQVILAMERTCRDSAMQLHSFVLTPRWSRPPHYVLHVESDGAADRSVLARLAEVLDRELGQVNVEYASKRASDRLGPVCLNRLPAGFFGQLDASRTARHRKINEQYKHQYLYTQPDADADFPSETR